MTASLSVSVVTYAPDLAMLRDTLRALSAALQAARSAGSLAEAVIELVDNGPGSEWTIPLGEIAHCCGARVISGHGNVGYGRGHNLSLLASTAEFHLVLNPDLIVDERAIDEALRFMAVHPQVVMLAPKVRGEDGGLQFLCKRYPSILDLVLRGFAPTWLKRRFEARLAYYEMRDLPLDQPTFGVPILSGSFMFCRREPIAAICGFADDFFVYFEDFDLSLRASRVGALAFVPQVKVVHFGGNAARKGWRHILLFARGAVVFFGRNGWRWW
ncbi:MAG: glycosyltransferase family 2 protein [Burkholderiales bacterium]|nr:glycosyltransferase family 2 protein [Burkholderiales bacterium]